MGRKNLGIEHHKQQRHEYYEKNKDKVREQNKRLVAARRQEINDYWWNYTTTNFSNRLHTSIKYRAKKKGLPFNLEVSDLIIPEKCPMTGIPLQIRTKKGEKNYFTPSVDRIVPELGYVKDNIRIVCLWYNTAKLMFTDEQVLDLCKKVVENNGSLSTS